MKTRSVVFALVAIMLMAPLALAKEEIILKSGEAGLVDVVETTEDTVTVKGSPEGGGTAQMKLKASQLDPHNFYNIRNAHMEKTLERNPSAPRTHHIRYHALTELDRSEEALSAIESALKSTSPPALRVTLAHRRPSQTFSPARRRRFFFCT